MKKNIQVLSRGYFAGQTAYDVIDGEGNTVLSVLYQDTVTTKNPDRTKELVEELYKQLKENHEFKFIRIMLY